MKNKRRKLIMYQLVALAGFTMMLLSDKIACLDGLSYLIIGVGLLGWLENT